jgi:Ribosomal protein L11 methyltransferase (PrmA)
VTYYLLNDEQREYLRGSIHGKTVADLGCGDGALAMDLAYWGAKHVHAVDKSPCRVAHTNVTFHLAYFDKWKMPRGVEVITLFWPQNNSLPGLVEILDKVPEVIYVGANTEGSACGNTDLFKHLTGREPVKCLPDRKNVLIHYRRENRTEPQIFHEENAAMSMHSTDPLRYYPGSDRKTPIEWRTR